MANGKVSNLWLFLNGPELYKMRNYQPLDNINGFNLKYMEWIMKWNGFVNI